MPDRPCPHCHNPIYDEEALRCHFCGESLNRPGRGLMSRMKYGPSSRLIFAAIAAVVILSFFLLLAF